MEKLETTEAVEISSWLQMDKLSLTDMLVPFGLLALLAYATDKIIGTGKSAVRQITS